MDPSFAPAQALPSLKVATKMQALAKPEQRTRVARVKLYSDRTLIRAIYRTKLADYWVGRKVLNLPYGPVQTLAGQAVMAGNRIRSRRPRKHSIGFDQEFRSEHMKFIDDAYEPNLIRRLQTAWQTLLEDGTRINRLEEGGVVYSEGIDSPTFPIHEAMPEVEGLLNEIIQHHVAGYYGTSCRPFRVTIWRNHHVPPELNQRKEIYSNRWHVDQNRADTLLLFVLLSDVGQDDGPFEACTAAESRTLGGRGFERERLGPARALELDKGPIRFIGPAGRTALLNNTRLLHRAGTPASGRTRDICQIMLKPSTHPPAPGWLSVGHPFRVVGRATRRV